MMRLVSGAAFLVFALLAAWLAIANRAMVNVSFDPISAGGPALQTEAPLYAVMLGAAFAGLLIGASSMWVLQGRHRKALREQRRRADRLQKMLAEEAVRGLPPSSQAATETRPARLA